MWYHENNAFCFIGWVFTLTFKNDFTSVVDRLKRLTSSFELTKLVENVRNPLFVDLLLRAFVWDTTKVDKNWWYVARIRCKIPNIFVVSMLFILTLFKKTTYSPYKAYLWWCDWNCIPPIDFILWSYIQKNLNAH